MDARWSHSCALRAGSPQSICCRVRPIRFSTARLSKLCAHSPNVVLGRRELLSGLDRGLTHAPTDACTVSVRLRSPSAKRVCSKVSAAIQGSTLYRQGTATHSRQHPRSVRSHAGGEALQYGPLSAFLNDVPYVRRDHMVVALYTESRDQPIGAAICSSGIATSTTTSHLELRNASAVPSRRATAWLQPCKICMTASRHAEWRSIPIELWISLGDC
jgi:hypothetical protein